MCSACIKHTFTGLILYRSRPHDICSNVRPTGEATDDATGSRVTRFPKLYGARFGKCCRYVFVCVCELCSSSFHSITICCCVSSEDGNFSMEVINQALKVFDLTAIPITNPTCRTALENPTYAMRHMWTFVHNSSLFVLFSC
jgi:hypothetical protein